MTIMQTVSGVESSNPGKPHRNVQNTAAINTASAEIPVVELYSRGSMKLATTISMTPNVTAVAISLPQPGETAPASNSGAALAVIIPTYGTKRRMQVRIAQSKGCGTPIKPSATPAMAP